MRNSEWSSDVCSTDLTGNATRVAKGNTTYTDSINYLPPNSFARARVIVGVDASAGVNSQTDPLPVVLRVTGPARSVYQNGRLLTTRIEGRSEERRVGKECVRTGRSRRAQYH